MPDRSRTAEGSPNMLALSHEDGGSGQPLILLHGFPFDRTMWASQTVRLRESMRVIVPDLRGYGQSALPSDGFAVDKMADDVLGLIDRLVPDEPVDLGGLSMGGYIAFSIVARHPEKVRSLMLLHTKAEADTPDQAQGRIKNAEAVEQTDDVLPVVDAMLPKLFSSSTRQRRPGLIEAFRKVMHAANPTSVSGTLRALAKRPDRTGLLPTITQPTLVIAGDQDPISPPETMEALAQAIPGAQFHRIPDVAHMSPVENPEQVTQHMIAFLQQRD